MIGRALPVLKDDGPEQPLRPERPERKDAQRNREKILCAARNLMERRGLDGVCMDELAAAAGVGKGTLYRRFQDKHALFRALLDDDERVLQDHVRRRFGHPKDASPTLVLMSLWLALVDFVLDHKDVLAAAEIEARSRAALIGSPPYHWRHVELTRWLRASGQPAQRAALLAHCWLHALAADVVREMALSEGHEATRAALGTLPEGVLLPRPASTTTPC